MKTFTITKKNFIDWYYNTGYDDDQEQKKIDLGQLVIDSLLEEKDFSFTIQNAWDECEKSCIPINRTNEYDKKIHEEHVELGELEEEWTIKLI